jgi:hypothetical protein
MSPNDLRRTCAAGCGTTAGRQTCAPVMGLVDIRMVERAYGRLPLRERPPKNPLNQRVCSGTESNRRHEDFQELLRRVLSAGSTDV